MAALDLIDIDQVELLRGPQGTLFGKNTTAGAIGVTTAAPSFTFGGVAQASYGNYDYQQYQASITGPLVGDVLAGRLTGYSTTRGGDVHDITTGTTVNDLGRQGVRGQLLYQPTPNFSLRVIGEYESEQQSTGAVLTINSLGATPSKLAKSLNAVGAVLVADPSGSTSYVGGGIATGTRQYAASAEANWKVDGFTLTSLTAFRRWDYKSYSDGDATAADVLNGGYDLKDSQWSQELRLRFPRLGPVDLITGLYYFQQDVHTDQITAYGADAAAWLTGIPNALLPTYARLSPAVAALLSYNNSRWDVIATPVTHSYAAFGQAVWHVSPVWNVTGGLRVTYETKDETVFRPNPTSLVTGAPVTGLASQTHAPFSVGIASTAPSFLISTDYHLSAAVMAYASVARGEKAGGVNTQIPGTGQTLDSLKVQPETATDYEVGLKGDLFDRRLSFNLDAYYTDVSNYQATYLSTVNGASVALLTNVGKVRTQGFEAEATLRPIAGLTLNATGSYNDAYYASYPNGPCAAENGGAVCNLTGRPVAGAPRWIANLDARYERPVSEGLVAYGVAEYGYRSHYYGYLDDSAYARTGDYGLTNLRLGLRAAQGRWDLSLWGKNVTDVRYAANYLSYGSLLPGVYVPFFGDPATYGATLRVTF